MNPLQDALHHRPLGVAVRGVRPLLGVLAALLMVAANASSLQPQEPAAPSVLGSSEAGLPFRLVIAATSSVTVDPTKCRHLTVNATGTGIGTPLLERCRTSSTSA